MGIHNNKIAPYNADLDIEKLSKNISKWGTIGFLRGFAGVRAEVLPKGKMNLPSAAFYEAALKMLNIGDPCDQEREYRVQYINTVEARLREIQAKAINEHFAKATYGQILDGVLALFILFLATSLILSVGGTHWITMLLIFLMAIKLLYMRWAVKRMLAISQEAFKAKVDDIKVPWQ